MARAGGLPYACELRIVQVWLRDIQLWASVAAVVASVGFASACDDQYADAVVYDGQGSARGPGPSVYSDGTAAGGAPWEGSSSDAGSPTDPGYETLCAVCSSHDDCGGHDDLCLPIGGDLRCTKECFGEWDCPREYSCERVFLSTGETWQCVPDRSTCAGSEPPPDLEEMRTYILSVVNELRDTYGLDPVIQDDCLDELGQAAAIELEKEGGVSSTKFDRECAGRIPDCVCGWQAESQASPKMSGRTWREAAEHPLKQAEASGQENSLFRNMFSSEWERIGIGALLDEDNLTFSLEFAP